MSVMIVDARSDLLGRLNRNKIALEYVVMADKSSHGQYALAVMGRAHVSNLTYKKNFYARVTFDNWKSYNDYYGAYMGSSADGKSDVFSFGFTRYTEDAVNVEFALFCIQNGVYYWDNNGHKNYKVYIPKNPFGKA